ncbi:phosphotransferase [Streptomyces sp. NPDC091272]|uniref:phosphotransferase n=1 Tax=Streptomyces sp. NPDC091272 TaxID=3365981 RepID=UPI0037FDF2DC
MHGSSAVPARAPKPGPPRPASADVYAAFVDAATRTGEPAGGLHHRNYVVPLNEAMGRLVGRPAGTTVTVRLGVEDALPVVVRTWADETQILDALRGVLPDVPRCLARSSHATVLSHVEGVPLSSICPNGEPVGPPLVEALVRQLAELAKVGREKLPRLPADWPRDGRSRQFLQHLAARTDRDVRQPNWAVFSGLFAALGVPRDAMAAFAERVPPMARRPFGLLHTDLHRDNVIVSPATATAPLLTFVDWELASYGDPLHDLAVHLVRMRYPAQQLDEVEGAWVRAMREAGVEAAAHGVESDLRHYLDFEHAQSVYPDVMRAARSLGGGREPVGLREAAGSVCAALAAARRPLRLGAVPDVVEVRQILSRWHAARAGRGGRAVHRSAGTDWVSPRFSAQEVSEALDAEGAAPSEQVFKGTGHLSTVVVVRGRTVVVRRRLRSATRRERCHNDESAVLAVLGGAGGVRAPRVLALGESSPSDTFAVHSFAGPPGRPPEHPVDGLSPHEADDLVDQLVALADVGVDGRGRGAAPHAEPARGTFAEVPPGRAGEPVLAPVLPPGGFYRWLSDQLVDLVVSLPPESLRAARELGLPGATRLREILSRRTVTPRPPVLLHGDLNPWNLVRGEAPGQLAIIDWEMAVVGDPLHDLVRHLHLTPHRGEIRRRMLARWSQALGRRDPRLVEGWAGDVHTYRWIELVRSAYVDLDRLVTGASLDAPNVRRAVDSYAMTLRAATESLGLGRAQVRNPQLALVLTRGDARPAALTRSGSPV